MIDEKGFNLLSSSFKRRASHVPNLIQLMWQLCMFALIPFSNIKPYGAAPKFIWILIWSTKAFIYPLKRLPAWTRDLLSRNFCIWYQRCKRESIVYLVRHMKSLALSPAHEKRGKPWGSWNWKTVSAIKLPLENTKCFISHGIILMENSKFTKLKVLRSPLYWTAFSASYINTFRKRTSLAINSLPMSKYGVPFYWPVCSDHDCDKFWLIMTCPLVYLS